MATHSSVLAWRIPGTEKPGRLQSMGSHRVRHDWNNLAAAAAALLCEQVRSQIRLETFTGKFSLSLFFFFFFFHFLSGYPTVWVAISHQLHQIFLRAFRPGSYTKRAACTSLSSPHSLLADSRVWTTSQLAVALRHVFCFVLLSSHQVMLSSEITKLPTDLPVRGFPAVWKLLLPHDFLPRTGLHS